MTPHEIESVLAHQLMQVYIGTLVQELGTAEAVLAKLGGRHIHGALIGQSEEGPYLCAVTVTIAIDDSPEAIAKTVQLMQKQKGG